MGFNSELVKITDRHAEEINDNNFERVILDAYLNGGISCVSELKKLFESAGVDMGYYDKAVEKIIKNLLKNSGLLEN